MENQPSESENDSKEVAVDVISISTASTQSTIVMFWCAVERFERECFIVSGTTFVCNDDIRDEFQRLDYLLRLNRCCTSRDVVPRLCL